NEHENLKAFSLEVFLRIPDDIIRGANILRVYSALFREFISLGIRNNFNDDVWRFTLLPQKVRLAGLGRVIGVRFDVDANEDIGDDGGIVVDVENPDISARHERASWLP